MAHIHDKYHQTQSQYLANNHDTTASNHLFRVCIYLFPLHANNLLAKEALGDGVVPIPPEADRLAFIYCDDEAAGIRAVVRANSLDRLEW